PAPPKTIAVREVPKDPPSSKLITVREAGPPPAAPARRPEPPAENRNEFADGLLEGSGLRSSLANYVESTNLLSFIDKTRLAEIEAPALERVVSRRFRAEAFQRAIAGQLRRSYSPERVPAVVEWLHSPATTRLAILERKAYSPAARDDLVKYAGGLSSSPPAQQRLELIHRIYDSLRTCDMEVETTIALVHTIAQSIGPA